MAFTIEQLRRELHRELRPIRENMAKVQADMADLRVDVARLPTKDDMREMVQDKTGAMRGNLLGWIVGTALAVIASLSGVVFGIAKLLE